MHKILHRAMGVADGFMEMKTHCFSTLHATNTFHVSLQHVPQMAHFITHVQTKQEKDVLFCLALKQLWLYRRCCYMLLPFLDFMLHGLSV